MREVESQLRALFVGGLPSLSGCALGSSSAAGQSSSSRLPKLGRRLLLPHHQIPVVEVLLLSRVLCCDVIRELKSIAVRMRFASGCQKNFTIAATELERVVQNKLRGLLPLLAARDGPFARRSNSDKAARSVHAIAGLGVALGASRAADNAAAPVRPVVFQWLLTLMYSYLLLYAYCSDTTVSTYVCINTCTVYSSDKHTSML